MPNPDMQAEFIRTQGLKGPKNKRKGNPLLRRKRLNFATPAQAERKEVWAFIKRCFIAAGAKCAHGPKDCKGILDLDHITPTGRGGKWEPENAQLLCRHHHNLKHGGPQWTGGDAA